MAVQQSDIIVLDEPTTALDLGHQGQVENTMLRFRQLGRTVVFGTHDPTLALRLCDRVALIRDGRLVQELMPPSTITAEQLSLVYGASIRMHHVADMGTICCLDGKPLSP